jgi:hypothetical protein
MTVTVTTANRCIVVDGKPLYFSIADFSAFVETDIKAVYWNGASGKKVFKDGSVYLFEDIAYIQPFIDVYNAEKARLIANTSAEAVAKMQIVDASALEAYYSPEQIALREAQALKAQIIADNLPSWAVIETAIDNIANWTDAKVFLKRLSKAVYWDIKNKGI